MAVSHAQLKGRTEALRLISQSLARIWGAIFGGICAFLTVFAHAYYGYPVYGYLGMPYTPLGIEHYMMLLVLAGIPGFFLKQRATKPGDFAVSVIYFFCYIPAISLGTCSGLLVGEAYAAHILCLFIGFCTLQYLAQMPVSSFRRPHIRPAAFICIVLFFYFWFLAWIVAENYSTMRLAGFFTVYDQRSVGGQAIGTSGYALGMLAGAVNPLLMSYGLFGKRRFLLFLGIVGQFVCFSVAANKIMIFAVIYIPVMYFLVGRRAGHLSHKFPPIVWMGPAYMFLLLVGLGFATIYFQTLSINADAFASQLLMRLILLPGSVTTQYAVFFQTNPLTYMTHVGFGRFIADSPYAQEVSLVLGAYLADQDRGMNANVNFFAYDGIASFGPIGMIVMGFIVGATLSIANRLVRRDMLHVVLVSMSALSFQMAEGSYFSAMLTYGGGLLFALFFLMPYDE